MLLEAAGIAKDTTFLSHARVVIEWMVRHRYVLPLSEVNCSTPPPKHSLSLWRHRREYPPKRLVSLAGTGSPWLRHIRIHMSQTR
jgi:hypothetical protein